MLPSPTTNEDELGRIRDIDSVTVAKTDSGEPGRQGREQDHVHQDQEAWHYQRSRKRNLVARIDLHRQSTDQPRGSSFSRVTLPSLQASLFAVSDRRIVFLPVRELRSLKTGYSRVGADGDVDAGTHSCGNLGWSRLCRAANDGLCSLFQHDGDFHQCPYHDTAYPYCSSRQLSICTAEYER